jgi:ribosome-associated translation inhibitor RaiA
MVGTSQKRKNGAMRYYVCASRSYKDGRYDCDLGSRVLRANDVEDMVETWLSILARDTDRLREAALSARQSFDETVKPLQRRLAQAKTKESEHSQAMKNLISQLSLIDNELAAAAIREQIETHGTAIDAWSQEQTKIQIEIDKVSQSQVFVDFLDADIGQPVSDGSHVRAVTEDEFMRLQEQYEAAFRVNYPDSYDDMRKHFEKIGLHVQLINDDGKRSVCITCSLLTNETVWQYDDLPRREDDGWSTSTVCQW